MSMIVHATKYRIMRILCHIFIYPVRSHSSFYMTMSHNSFIVCFYRIRPEQPSFHSSFFPHLEPLPRKKNQSPSPSSSVRDGNQGSTHRKRHIERYTYRSIDRSIYIIHVHSCLSSANVVLRDAHWNDLLLCQLDCVMFHDSSRERSLYAEIRGMLLEKRHHICQESTSITIVVSR
jgi:hypothetical protein